jgi:predicted nucleic acid-binding protein
MNPVAASAVGLIDTGVIIALLHRSDGRHAACVQAFNNFRLPLLTTEAALTETFYLAARIGLDSRAIWRLLRSGAIRLSPITHEELPAIQRLMDDYADRPMDFADATLVHLAARERLSWILTVDHGDFETYRLPGRKKFSILPSRSND